MKRLVLILLLSTVAHSSIVGQAWSPQLGIQGGILRQKPTGTGQADQVDRWELPSSGTIQSSFYLIAPLSGRIGLESSLAASHTKFKEASGLVPGSSSSDTRLTVRANIALTSSIYVAAGGLLRRREIDGGHSIQTGLLGAVGVQPQITRSLTARIEAQWLTQRRTDSMLPSNVYALLFGVSQRLLSPAARSSGGTRTFRPWRLQVGAAGGYVRTHLYGSISGLYVDGSETITNLPGSQGTTPTPLFLDVPLRGRLALEAGFGIEHTQQNGATFFDGHVAPRLNVAIYRGFYAAAGGNIRYLKQTGGKGFALAGANVATGYRFLVVGPVEGRVEASFTAFKERANFPLAQNAAAALLGVAMALQ